LAVGVAAVAQPDAARAGKLGAVRSAVRGGSGGSSSSSASGSSSSSSSGSSGWSFSWGSNDDDDDDDDDDDVSLGAGYNSTCCVDDDLFPTDAPRYTRYPYAETKHGYVERVPEAEKDERGRMFAGRAMVEGGYMGDNVWRSGLGLRLAYWRLALDNELHFYLEQPLRDALYLGTTNATFDFLMRPNVLWRLGGGLNYMIDGRTPGEGRREYAAGANFTTSIDVFPIQPLILSGRFDYGTLYKARVLTGRATIGFTYHGIEVFGGYEYKAIGNVPLHGPIAGLRLWF
jgi:hypothetical protein